MKFDHPETVEQLIWEMKLADYPRGLNRSRIQELFDGWPPYTDAEVKQNNLAVNVNFLEASTIAHDARRQFSNAFLNTDPLFTVNIDHGPLWKRKEWSNIIQKEINRIIKGSPSYMESRRSTFALDVLHGIAPSVWRDKYRWSPRSRGVEDMLIPSDTLLDMENLPFFAVYEQYTAFELWRATHGPRVDPGWNMQAVNAAIEWVDRESQQLMSASWPEIWSPEKMDDRIKQDGGLFASDKVPTVDTFHFYWWDDSGKVSGWRKKIVLDAWGEPGVGGAGGMNPNKVVGKYGMKGTKGETYFLYDSGNRRFADDIRQLVHFQFADGSCKAPFKYHAVRSLGYLLFNICHLQNRLRCKFTEATFESLMQYYRVKNMADAERALRIDLTDKTPLPDGVEFVRAEERWKIDAKVFEMCMSVNRQTMNDNSSSFTQDFEFESQEQETATRTMAKINNSAALVAAMLGQAYNYQKFQYDEICRRFCIKNSRDPDVRTFRVNVLKKGVPEEVLYSDWWDVQPVRVIGSGNKMLQVAMTDKLMGIYNKLEPAAQREAKRLYIAVNSDDWDMANRWVPEEPQITQSIHDAQVSAGIMLSGSQLGLVENVNHTEYVEAMLVALGSKVQEIKQRGEGAMTTPQELMGIQNLAGMSIQGKPMPGNGIYNHIQIIAQDAQQQRQKGQPEDNSVKEKVKQYNDALKMLMNEVRGFAQRMIKAQQAQAQQQQRGGGIDPKDAAKIAGQTLIAQTKAKLASESHAQRTAQRQIQFEQQVQQDEQKHALEMRRDAERGALEMATKARSFEE